MKHTLTAAVALAAGLGLAVAANAAGTMQSGSMSNSASPNSSVTQPMQATQSSQRLTRSDIKQAQEQLKTDGLYNGRVDGRIGKSTRAAISRFQEKNNLPRTARLDTATRDQLMGSQGVGVGSSMPSGSNSPATSANGTSTTPVMPPATQAPSAGDNTTSPTTTTPSTSNNMH